MSDLVPLTSVTQLTVQGQVRWTGLARLPGHGRPLALLVMRHGERLVAMRDRCPHRDISLARGLVRPDGTIECPSHGLAVPIEGYEAVERDGALYVNVNVRL